MTHDPLCAKSPTGVHYVGTCTCALIYRVREDERQEAGQRVLNAPEHCVKIKGIMTAVIQRSDAHDAAEGVSA